MVDAEAVRRVGLALPRSYEAFIGGRWKLKVRQLVYVAFSRDETSMGFGFPRVERDGLIASDPETFFLPPTSDLRYQWVCAHLDRLTRPRCASWSPTRGGCACRRCCTTLPEQPAPVAAAWAALDAGDWGELRPLLHPYLHWQRPARRAARRGQGAGPPHDIPTPRPPTEVEIRDGQVYRWWS